MKKILFGILLIISCGVTAKLVVYKEGENPEDWWAVDIRRLSMEEILAMDKQFGQSVKFTTPFYGAYEDIIRRELADYTYAPVTGSSSKFTTQAVKITRPPVTAKPEPVTIPTIHIDIASSSEVSPPFYDEYEDIIGREHLEIAKSERVKIHIGKTKMQFTVYSKVSRTLLHIPDDVPPKHCVQLSVGTKLTEGGNILPESGSDLCFEYKTKNNITLKMCINFHFEFKGYSFEYCYSAKVSSIVEFVFHCVNTTDVQNKKYANNMQVMIGNDTQQNDPIYFFFDPKDL